MFNYSPDTLEKMIIVVITAFCSGIVSYFIGRNVGRNNLRYQNFLNAATEFRNTFLDMIVFLDESHDTISIIEKILGFNQESALEIIQHNIDNQERAYIKFRHYLKGTQRDDFIKAWKEYASPNYEKNEDTFSDSFRRIIEYKKSNPAKELKVRKIIRERINVLLSYAPTK